MQFGPQLVTKYENCSESKYWEETELVGDLLDSIGIIWLMMLISHHFVLKWKPSNQISLVKFLVFTEI